MSASGRIRERLEPTGTIYNVLPTTPQMGDLPTMSLTHTNLDKSWQPSQLQDYQPTAAVAQSCKKKVYYAEENIGKFIAEIRMGLE